MDKEKSPTVQECMCMMDAYGSLSERALESMRRNAESEISHYYGASSLSEKRNRARAVFEHSIAATMLDEKFGKRYQVADFDECGHVVMRDADIMGVRNSRPLPSYQVSEEETVPGVSL